MKTFTSALLLLLALVSGASALTTCSRLEMAGSVDWPTKGPSFSPRLVAPSSAIAAALSTAHLACLIVTAAGADATTTILTLILPGRALFAATHATLALWKLT